MSVVCEGVINNFPVLIIKHEKMGHLCGYIAVPEGHPCYRKHYDQEPALSLSVHGGITYSEGHPPMKEGDKQWWWLGFDCAHSGDLVPGYYFRNSEDVYRDETYVMEQLREMSVQLAPEEFMRLVHKEKK